ncbi:DUF2301 domain-containing membrane protein [Pannus brasiliensis CCIBt3594]|uniref:DUF2301 domain-containing membrane protein n=1 Tax=Pannus brasiliensis CCIBt3594 TaxID=1427578 RepID=A0AAW9QY52_9CHRO
MISSSSDRVYQGQFGEFRVTDSDRFGVILYRLGLAIAALGFALGTGYAILIPGSLSLVTVFYALFCLGLGLSLLTIHIYLIPLHRLLQIFWGVGAIASLVLSIESRDPLALFVYEHPISLLGVGFIFASLTGIYFKEAFCFDRLETKLLTPLVPILLLGHLAGILPIGVEKGFVITWSILFLIFAARKFFQPIPNDIGDKSVFEHLKHS